MSLFRNPLAQFLAISLLLLVLISSVTGYLAERAAEREAISEALTIHELAASSVIEADLTRRVLTGSRGAIDQYDREVLSRLQVDSLLGVNLRDESGRLRYSSRGILIGDSFEFSQQQREVLSEGGTGYDMPGADAPIASPPEATRDVVQIYTRVAGPGDRQLLFEGYYRLEDIEQRRAQILSSFRWITLGGPLLIVLLTTPILWALTRRLTHAGRERERLLHALLDASDAERRRIARDLHDSVVQDLAGTAFSISAVARDPVTPPTARERLDDAGGSLRVSLKGLRSLLAEIHPPDLQAESLPAALEDLIAPAAGAGVQASLSVAGVDDVPDACAALVWRVAQEAVRNALRHAEASTLDVTVRGDGRLLVLDVVDDGVGFEPSRAAAGDSFGLRGLRSLVSEAGGTLEVRSAPGEGTRVRMEVEVR
ncbi:sensor histidine kinase [Nocardioides sp. GCM10027113]|uniref:sensor histidine kinase n=1 Tax=unclassified Nocardioides TaxID=2615069 RepID=UPI0036093D35